MFHSSTELLIDYWRGRRGERAMPARADIDPSAFAALAPRAFVAARETNDIRFRLAGEDVIAAFGRPAASDSVLKLWRPEHRGRVNAILGAALIAGEPMVIEAQAICADALAVRLELLFAPLTAADGVADRFLGLCQPLTTAPAGGLAADLAIVAVNGHAAERGHLRLAAVGGRRIA